MSIISMTNEDVSRMENFAEGILSHMLCEKWNAYEVLLEECNKTKYRQAIESAKDFEDSYNNGVRKEIKKKYETWLEDDDCPSRILIKEGATDQEDENWQNAKLLEGKIEEMLYQTVMKELSFPQVSGASDRTDTIETMNAIKEAYKKDKKKLESLLDEVKRKEKEVDDERIFEGVCVLLEGILVICEEFFENRVGGTKRLISDAIKPGEKAVENAIKEEKRNNKTTAELLNDLLVGESGLFKGGYM